MSLAISTRLVKIAALATVAIKTAAEAVATPTPAISALVSPAPAVANAAMVIADNNANARYSVAPAIAFMIFTTTINVDFDSTRTCAITVCSNRTS